MTNFLRSRAAAFCLFAGLMGAGVLASPFAAAQTSGAAMCRAQCDGLPEVVYKTIDDIPAPVISYLQNAEFYENAVSQALTIIRQHGEDKRYLTPESVRKIEVREEVERRRNQLSQIVVFDADLDGFITPQEIEAYLTVMGENKWHGNEAQRKSQEIMKMDANKDGRVSLKESADWAQSNIRSYGGRTAKGLAQFLALDIDGDGKFSDKEMTAVIHAAFAVLDVNGDGVLNQNERSALADRQRRIHEMEQLERLREVCKMPVAANDVDIAFLATREGSALSSADLSAEGGHTQAIEVNVSTLDKKTYLILAAHRPVIWDVTGDVSKLSQVVVMGNVPFNIRAGIKGVPKERVSFVTLTDCLPQLYNEMSSGKREEMPKTKQALMAYIGRAPDLMQFIQTLHTATLLRGGFVLVQSPPPEKLAQVPQGFDAEIWQDRIVKSGKDLRMIAASDVVSQVAVNDMKVLPGAYGLAKLLHDGVIEKVPSGSFTQEYREGGITIVINEGDGSKVVSPLSGGARKPVYDYRLKRETESLPSSYIGINRLLVREGMKVPSDLGLSLCPKEERVDGELVYARRCKGP